MFPVCLQRLCSLRCCLFVYIVGSFCCVVVECLVCFELFDFALLLTAVCLGLDCCDLVGFGLLVRACGFCLGAYLL